MTDRRTRPRPDIPVVDHYRLRLASRHVSDAITSIEMYQRHGMPDADDLDLGQALDHLLVAKQILAGRISPQEPQPARR